MLTLCTNSFTLSSRNWERSMQTKLIMAYQSYADMVAIAKAEGMPDGENPTDYGVDPIRS